jgi:uncharacterized tellurite resistance protein B-like protein
MLLPLAKVIIAAAWADGEVSAEEINIMKDLFFGRLELTGQDWSVLDMYIEAPVSDEERERLITDLNAHMRSRSDRDSAIQAINDLIAADGEVTTAEEEIASTIIEALKSESVGALKQITGLFQAPLSRRAAVLAGAPNREAHFEDFLKNKVYYGIQRRLNEGADPLDIAEADLRRLCLAGGLMARIAQADRKIAPEERQVMEEALQDHWKLGRREAGFVAEVALSEIGPTLEYYRMARQFFAVTSEQERKGFVDVLFRIAAADGHIASVEHEEIRSINNVLKLTHQDFISAKLKSTGGAA